MGGPAYILTNTPYSTQEHQIPVLSGCGICCPERPARNLRKQQSDCSLSSSNPRKDVHTQYLSWLRCMLSGRPFVGFTHVPGYSYLLPTVTSRSPTSRNYPFAACVRSLQVWERERPQSVSVLRMWFPSALNWCWCTHCPPDLLLYGPCLSALI